MFSVLKLHSVIDIRWLTLLFYGQENFFQFIFNLIWEKTTQVMV